MVSTSQAGGQRSNQSSINQGIRKVIGSPNRGFASLDPERQRGVFIQHQAVREAAGKSGKSGAGNGTGSSTAACESAPG
jgi:hypothetical protein